MVDINNNFSVTLNIDTLFILLENYQHAYQRVMLPHIELLIDKNNNIVGHIFRDIPSDMRRELEEGIAASVSYGD